MGTWRSRVRGCLTLVGLAAVVVLVVGGTYGLGAEIQTRLSLIGAGSAGMTLVVVGIYLMKGPAH